ncbi:MAG: hypothetical protein C4346_09025 [Chloroflexota bacterium]
MPAYKHAPAQEDSSTLFRQAAADPAVPRAEEQAAATWKIVGGGDHVLGKPLLEVEETMTGEVTREQCNRGEPDSAVRFPP